MRKILAAAVATTLLVGGAAASVAFGAGFVGAQESDEPEEPAPRHDLKFDPLDDLVAEGTLTQEQADAVAAAIDEAIGRVPDDVLAIVRGALDDLVADGTLTQGQVDALIAAAGDEPDGRKIGGLFGLIEDGTLSAKEAEAIVDAVRQAFIEEGPLAGPFGRRAMILAGVLDGLVAEGTLTQEESDAIVDALRERCRDRLHHHGPEEMAEASLSLA